MPIRLFKPTGAERVAFVSELPSSDGEGLLVQVAKGPSRAKLQAPKLFGPMTREVADAIVAREVAALQAEGFVRSGLADLLVQLESKRRKRRALAARRLGWLRERAAVDALLALAAKANEELPVVVDALGELGDARAIPVARAAAERKLLSRRRAGVEALRKLGDLEGLADAQTRALERIPANVQAALSAVDAGAADASAVAQSLGEVPLKDRGLAIDSVYELALPVSAAVARRALLASEGTDFTAPHVWRYAKSILKRAMLRHDAETFGALAHAIEQRVWRTSGETATVKSGLDGTTKKMRIFGPRTQRWVLRFAWRYLRMLGRYRPDLYARSAAEVLVAYGDADAAEPKGLHGAYARCYLLGRILYGGSTRHLLEPRTLRLRLRSGAVAKPSLGAREESFPELWDRHPLAYVRLLSGAKLVLVQELAFEAVTRRHPGVLAQAPHAWIVGMLGAPHPPTVEMGLTELRRRFDPTNPDWTLVLTVLHDARPTVRDLGLEWIERCAALWTTTPERVVLLLSGGDGTARSSVAAHVVAALASADAGARSAMAAAVWGVLVGVEKHEGEHDAYAAIARELLPEIAASSTAAALLALLGAASAATRATAAGALALHRDVDAVLGLAEVVVMGAHPQVSIRDAARTVLRRRIATLRRDPSVLFALLDSEWSDMRTFAAGLVDEELSASDLSLDVVMGIADSPHPDVQELGKVLVARRLGELPTSELLAKLLEHPHRNMRLYVLELVVAHLKEGFVALASAEEFLRTLLFDVSPDRKAKRLAITFLKKRGVTDPRQAEIARRLLGELLKSKTVFDFDLALDALTQIELAHTNADVTEASAPLRLDHEGLS